MALEAPSGWSLPIGYEFVNIGRCSAAECGAAIQWAITPKGNKAPFDANGGSHWATCPAAATFRKPKPEPKPGPYIPGPPTGRDPLSIEAAAAVAPSARNLREEVLVAIRERDGVAEWELERVLALPGNTVRPRLKELEARGLIHRDGTKVRPSSGRKTALYHATKENA